MHGYNDGDTGAKKRCRQAAPPRNPPHTAPASRQNNDFDVHVPHHAGNTFGENKVVPRMPIRASLLEPLLSLVSLVVRIVFRFTEFFQQRLEPLRLPSLLRFSLL